MKKFSLKETLISFLFFISFLYVSFFLPLSFSTYNAKWFKFVCNFHNRCERIGNEKAHSGIDQLTGFLAHSNELDSRWTPKEKLHLKEVRGILDNVVKLFLVMFLILLLTYDKKRLKKFSLINFFIVSSLLIVLPFFKTFWRDVFHPLFFDNNLWLNNRFDFSYWIMPRKFFFITVGFIVISCAIVNLMSYLVCRKLELRKPEKKL